MVKIDVIANDKIHHCLKQKDRHKKILACVSNGMQLTNPLFLCIINVACAFLIM
jgi:hypothetical protein